MSALVQLARLVPVSCVYAFLERLYQTPGCLQAVRILWLWYYPCNHQINWHKIHVKFFNIWGLPWNSTVGLKFSKVLGKWTNQSCNSRMCKHTWTLWIFIHGEFSLLAPFIFLQIVCLKEEEESSYPDGSLSSDCDHKCLLWLLHDATPTLALLNFGKFFLPMNTQQSSILEKQPFVGM